MRNKPRLFPSVRLLLIHLHLDLFAIDRKAQAGFGDDILSDFEKVVLVLEDRRFFEHNGVDMKAVVRNVWKACTFRKYGGASTIDMQFVRTATGYRERTLRRKLYEMLLASIIQWRYTKAQILRSYLACAFFGSHMYGAESASDRAFEKTVSELSIQQMSELASMLVFPRPLRPDESWRLKIQKRAAYGIRVLSRLKQRFEKIPRGK